MSDYKSNLSKTILYIYSFDNILSRPICRKNNITRTEVNITREILFIFFCEVIFIVSIHCYPVKFLNDTE